jgi:F-type H+-transporting ATPase subunit gamma
METLETLQRRIDTTRDLQSIVRTMKTLSSVTIRRSEEAAQAARAYDEAIDMGLQILLRNRKVADRAVAAAVAERRGPLGLIVMGSDHGLCGRFNRMTAEAALEQIASHGQYGVTLAAVGARVADLLGARGHEPGVVHAAPGSIPGLRETTGALLALSDDWRRRGIVRLRIVHAVQASRSPARPASASLLPLSPAYLKHLATRRWPSRSLPTHTERPDILLTRLIREHVFVRLFRALAETQASEHAARLAAMRAAEEGIRDHLSEMDGEFRQRRQEQITTEMLDVVAGALALEEDPDAEDRDAG